MKLITRIFVKKIREYNIASLFSESIGDVVTLIIILILIDNEIL